MEPEKLKRIRELEDKMRELMGRMSYIADMEDPSDEDGEEFERLEAEYDKVDEEYFGEIKGCITRLGTTGQQSDLDSLKWHVHALQSFLSAHAQKEDDLLLPLIDSELGPEKQGEMVGQISAHIPPELLEPMLKWIIGALTVEERADWLGIIQGGAPPEGFVVMMAWVNESLPAADWGELLEKKPGLA
jgi:hypothetical protein